MTVSNYGCRYFFSDLDVGAESSKIVLSIATINTTFEGILNNQQYNNKITST